MIAHKPVLSAISQKPAHYFDPVTGKPYSTMEEFKELRKEYNKKKTTIQLNFRKERTIQSMLPAMDDMNIDISNYIKAEQQADMMDSMGYLYPEPPPPKKSATSSTSTAKTQVKSEGGKKTTTKKPRKPKKPRVRAPEEPCIINTTNILISNNVNTTVPVKTESGPAAQGVTCPSAGSATIQTKAEKEKDLNLYASISTAINNNINQYLQVNGYYTNPSRIPSEYYATKSSSMAAATGTPLYVKQEPASTPASYYPVTSNKPKSIIIDRSKFIKDPLTIKGISVYKGDMSAASKTSYSSKVNDNLYQTKSPSTISTMPMVKKTKQPKVVKRTFDSSTMDVSKYQNNYDLLNYRSMSLYPSLNQSNMTMKTINIMKPLKPKKTTAKKAKKAESMAALQTSSVNAVVNSSTLYPNALGNQMIQPNLGNLANTSMVMSPVGSTPGGMQVAQMNTTPGTTSAVQMSQYASLSRPSIPTQTSTVVNSAAVGSGASPAAQNANAMQKSSTSWLD